MTPDSMTLPKATSRLSRTLCAGLAIGALLAGSGGVTASSAATARTSAIIVSALKTKKYGTILVSRRTLYTLKASKVACAATCFKFWPELLLPKGVTKAQAANGVRASKLGTIMRAGGRRQVTYAGKALYYFASDTSAGQVKGNITDTWGKWSVIVLVQPVGGSTTTTTGGGGGGIGF